jgi:hypothetical protein
MKICILPNYNTLLYLKMFFAIYSALLFQFNPRALIMHGIAFWLLVALGTVAFHRVQAKDTALEIYINKQLNTIKTCTAKTPKCPADVVNFYRNAAPVTLKSALVTAKVANPADEVKQAHDALTRRPHEPLLKDDEKEAIWLYTAKRNIYEPANAALRTGDKGKIGPWAPYLKILHEALLKLPAQRHPLIVYRGEQFNGQPNYVVNQEFVWGAFTSASESTIIAHNFMNELDVKKLRTLFNITTSSGRKIANISRSMNERECLLMPAIKFRVTRVTNITPSHYREVYLQEI